LAPGRFGKGDDRPPHNLPVFERRWIGAGGLLRVERRGDTTLRAGRLPEITVLNVMVASVPHNEFRKCNFARIQSREN
jgi:hypothetical protein